MKKLAVWMIIGTLLLGMVYALAESSTAATQKTSGGQTVESTPSPKASSAPGAVSYHPLEKGDSGDDVKALQQRLTELGYYNGKISGNYLDGSYYAISDFQGKNGLPVTGKADEKTLELLFDSEKALPKTGTIRPDVTPAPTPIPASMPTPTPAPTAGGTVGAQVSPTPAPAELKYTKRLQKGSKGDKVKLLQEELAMLGYYTDPVSGKYDDNTKAAVKAFQKNNGLTADGITGEETWNMLFMSDETLDASATPRPTPAPTPPPYALVVDVKNQVITAYGLDENNEYTIVVRRMICSTGTYATPSDVGVWKLNSGRSRFPLFPKFGVYVQYWTPIVNGIGFHSVIYNTKNTMDLAVGSYRQLGTRASHGCIRLLVDDAKWIYENAGKGTQVTITDKLPSDPELTQSLKPAALNKKNMLPKETPAPTPPPVFDSAQQPPMPLRTLNKGDKGEDVYWLQMKLTELGYYTGTVTGGYYGGTQKAVKAYQKDNGLTADGVAGVKTQSHLYADVLPTPSPAPAPTPKPTPNTNKK